MLRRLVPLSASVLLAACVSGGGAPPPLPKLAGDRGQPELALLEHALTGYFAGAGATAPTTCAALSPTALTAEQEEALIVRFARLAPIARCRAQGSGVVDAITGAPARLVQLYDFTCRDAGHCAGWVAAGGAPAMLYAMHFEGGTWRFAGDPRTVAE
ncbi:MAG TPA: hypothetical protein VEB68_04705 [Croceibacterium sp.]|nr:hypothetical protein [Croceibacterium sp.]